MKARRILGTAAGLAVVLSPVTMAATSAQAAPALTHKAAAAQTHKPDDFDVAGSFCWGTSDGGSSCIWTDGTSGDTLRNETYFAGGQAQVYILEQAECHIIGPGCGPFTSGSGDNTLYTGDEIGTLENVHDGRCVDFPSLAGNVKDGSCSGSNGEVVVYGGGAEFGAPIIFVSASDAYYAEDGRQRDSVVLAGNVNNTTSGFLGVNLGDPGNFSGDSNLNFGELGL